MITIQYYTVNDRIYYYSSEIIPLSELLLAVDVDFSVEVALALLEVAPWDVFPDG